MPVIPITLIQGDTVDNTKTDYRDALPVNMYAIPKPILGAQGYMQQIHGLTQFGTASTSSDGAIYCTAPNFEGHYRVHGSDFIRVDDAGNVTVLGTVSGAGQCVMWHSFRNVAVIRDEKLYYYNPTDGFRQIVDNPAIGSNVRKPVGGCYVGSIMFLTDGNQIYHCQFEDVGSVSNEEVFLGTSSGRPEFVSDFTYAVRQSENDEVVVFGSRSIQHYYLSGGELFAFTPLDQKNRRLGVVGTHAMGLLSGSWYMVGRSNESAPSIYNYSQGSYKKIATREIEQILSAYTETQLEGVTVDTLVEDDVSMVIFHLPDTTLMFSPTVAAAFGPKYSWSILKSDALGNKQYRAKDFVQDPRINQFIVGDRLNGNLGIFDDGVSTHYGDIAEWILYTPVTKLEGLSINYLEIEVITGLADQSNDATVAVSTTYNNGRTYTNEYWELYGDQYDYDKRFYIHRMGYVRDTIGFKFRGASRSRMAFGLMSVEVS